MSKRAAKDEVNPLYHRAAGHVLENVHRFVKIAAVKGDKEGLIRFGELIMQIVNNGLKLIDETEQTQDPQATN